MRLSDNIYKKLCEYKASIPYYDYRMEFVLILGTESWKMLYEEMKDYLSYSGYPQEHDSFMGMRIKVVEKKFHVEIKVEY